MRRGQGGGKKSRWGKGSSLHEAKVQVPPSLEHKKKSGLQSGEGKKKIKVRLVCPKMTGKWDSKETIGKKYSYTHERLTLREERRSRRSRVDLQHRAKERNHTRAQ